VAAISQYADKQLFLLALSFYTRIPCPPNLDYQRLPAATVYLPVIGWLVGACSGLVFWLATLLWPPSIAILLAIITGVLLTGGFHEDGFADVCDGFGGGWNKDQILTIMKDSRIGAYGALGLVLLMALKVSVLDAIPAVAIPSVLLAGHSLSRFCPLLIMHGYHYARNVSSKAGAAVYQPKLHELLFAGATALLPCVLLPVICVLAIIPIVLANSLLGRYFYRHIGGYTGDCLGASQQLAELMFYLAVSALWTFI
jgi:adenosylcobinamide-GDP ribazoletransferase